MTQAPPQVALNSSRLVRFLYSLAVSDIEPSHKDFAQRFGQLFDFSDSISLSALHEELASLPFEPREVASSSVQDEFLRVRKSLVQSIIRRFIAGEDGSIVRGGFPSLRPGASLETLLGFDAYQRFYLARQRDMEREIQLLQTHVRDAAMGLSPQLAQLVALDAALGDSLIVHRRKFLATVPALLQKRFEQLREQHADDNEALMPPVWLKHFAQDTQELLLAELEVRLQPLLGLVEAINETVDTLND